MGALEVTVNPYILYSMLGVIILMMITMMGVLFRLLYVVGNLAGRMSTLEKSLADFRQEVAAHVIRLDSRIDRVEAAMTDLRGRMENRIDRVEASMAALREQTSAALGELRGMVMALNQKIDLLMRHRHDAVSDDVLLAPTAPEIAAD